MFKGNVAMSEPVLPDAPDDGDVTKAWKAAAVGNRTMMISLLQGWLPRRARRTSRKLNCPINDTGAISQEASMRAYLGAKSKQWQSKEHFVNWIDSVLRNIGIDIYRHEHGRKNDVVPCQDEVEPVAEAKPRPIVKTQSDVDCFVQRNPAFSLVDRLTLQQTLELLKGKAPMSYEVIKCRHLSESDVVSVEATAKQLGVGMKQVKALEQNAFRFIKSHLSNESRVNGSR
jgi:DNA-directed RNA polymerase specialized sigma24 family protein